MECIEQAELLPDADVVNVLMAQAQILTRVAEDLDARIVETIEDEEDPEAHDLETGRPPSRHRANYTP